MSNRQVGTAPGARRWMMPLRAGPWLLGSSWSKRSFSSGALLGAHFGTFLSVQVKLSLPASLSQQWRETFRLWQAENWLWSISHLCSLCALICLFWSGNKREWTTVWLLHDCLEKNHISPKTLQLGTAENVSLWVLIHRSIFHPPQVSSVTWHRLDSVSVSLLDGE